MVFPVPVSPTSSTGSCCDAATATASMDRITCPVAAKALPCTDSNCWLYITVAYDSSSLDNRLPQLATSRCSPQLLPKQTACGGAQQRLVTTGTGACFRRWWRACHLLERSLCEFPGSALSFRGTSVKVGSAHMEVGVCLRQGRLAKGQVLVQAIFRKRPQSCNCTQQPPVCLHINTRVT